jgi:hypothetical protein
MTIRERANWRPEPPPDRSRWLRGCQLASAFKPSVLVFTRIRISIPHISSRQISPSVVELISLAFRPRVEMTNVRDDLAIWSYSHLGTVHRSRSRTFEVNSLAVIAAAMTRALEFVLGWLPIGRAAQVRAACIDDEKLIRCAVHPNPVLLQIFLVDTERIVGWEPNLEDGRRFKEHTRQEETKERDEPCRKKSSHAAPNKSAAPPVRDGVRRSDGRYTGCGCRFRSPNCRSADVLRGVRPGDRLSCGRDERLLPRFAFSLHVFHRCFVRQALAPFLYIRTEDPQRPVRTTSMCRPAESAIPHAST